MLWLTSLSPHLLSSLTLTRQIFLLCFTDASFSGTPPSYAYDADRAEEQRRHHDMMPYIDDSPSSSPHLSSKSRGSRDTLSSGSLESTKSVSPFLPFWSQQSLVELKKVDCFNREQRWGLNILKYRCIKGMCSMCASVRVGCPRLSQEKSKLFSDRLMALIKHLEYTVHFLCPVKME